MSYSRHYFNCPIPRGAGTARVVLPSRAGMHHCTTPHVSKETVCFGFSCSVCSEATISTFALHWDLFQCFWLWTTTFSLAATCGIMILSMGNELRVCDICAWDAPEFMPCSIIACAGVSVDMWLVTCDDWKTPCAGREDVPLSGAGTVH